MAGIGVKLNNIYGKRTLTTNIIGMDGVNFFL